jgi:hypothetical protein
LSSDNTIKLTATIEVQTYYPSFLTVLEAKPFRTRWFNNIIALKQGPPRGTNDSKSKLS